MFQFCRREVSTLKHLKFSMGIATENPLIWLNKCFSIASHSHSSEDLTYVSNLLGKWFEKFIFFTGDSQVIKEPVCKLDSTQLHKIEYILLKTGNLSTHAKVINYHLNLLKVNRDLANYNKLRQQSRLNKFKYYSEQFGGLQVIGNGMFNKFSFPLNTKYNTDDFNFLCEILAQQLANKKWTIQSCIYLIEQMHGFHIKKSSSTYHKGLSPNIQMSRIINCSLRRNPENDELLHEYKQLMQSINASQKRENKPNKLSSGQRNRKITEKGIKFGKLPLNILLRTMWIQYQKETFKSDIPIHEIAFRLISILKRSRDTRPNQETLLALILLFHSDTSLQKSLPLLLENFQRHCPINEKVINQLQVLGYDSCGNIKNTT